jgi:NAD(P)-dependent dehydrogenase (short-subunit alcohol dehydrogenase family)
VTNALVLGGWGALGQAVAQHLTDDGLTVHRTSRTAGRPDTTVVAGSDDARNVVHVRPLPGPVSRHQHLLEHAHA